jgi:hypothetical protein
MMLSGTNNNRYDHPAVEDRIKALTRSRPEIEKALKW